MSTTLTAGRTGLQQTDYAPKPPHADRASSRPVRVCFMIDELSRAGTETQLLALIRGLDRRRVRPSLVLLNGDSAESRALEPADCPTLRLHLRRLVGTRTVTAGRQLLRFWRDQQVDILQAYFLDSAYLGIPLARFARIGQVIRVRNNLGYWLTAKHKLLNKIVGRLTDVTLTNSEAGKTALLAAEGGQADKIQVIGNGVDLDRFTRLTPPFSNTKQIRIGTVANLRPVKNIDGLIRAFQNVAQHEPRLHLEIAGEGPERPELQQLIAQAGLEARVRLLGSVTNVPEFLGRLDLAVLPSHSEGMSNALLEFMAAARPIVATDVGANRQLLADNGWLVPAGTDADLAEALALAVADPELAVRFGQQARQRAEEQYSRQAMIGRFEEFYRQRLSPKSFNENCNG